jgi:hypothetical protein
MTADEIKREFDRGRLISLAESEGLGTAPGRIQCPHRCSEEKRGASVTDSSNGALWNCKRCNAGGSAIDLIMAARHLELDEAVLFLSSRLGGLPPAAPPKPAPDVGALWRELAPTDEAGIEYLRGRGLEAAAERSLVRFNVGGLGHKPRCRKERGCVRCWLDWKANTGYRVGMLMYGLDGGPASFQLRSIAPGVDPTQSKISLSGAAYPPGGVAFGSIGQARMEHRVFISEGMADTLAFLVAGEVVLGAPGVDQLRKLSLFLADVQGRTVILCPQNDAPRVAAGKKVRLTSERAFAELAETLGAGGANVLTFSTPHLYKDPADYFKAVGREQFKLACDDTQSLEGGDGGGTSVSGNNVLKFEQRPKAVPDARPEILIKPEEHLVIAESIRALRKDEHLFQRDGKLIHIVRDLSLDQDTAHGQEIARGADAPRISQLPLAVLRTRLAEHAKFTKVRKSQGGRVPDHPPDWVVRGVHGAESWNGIRSLRGITECPVLRPDGTILDTPGYDSDTRLLFEPSMPFLAVPPNPTREQIAAALRILCDETICDFPFERSTHMSAWIASMFSPLARPAFEGPIPLFAVDSNTRGSGKSKLCDLVSIVVTGREMPRMPVPGNDEEWRKRIATVALAGDPVVLLDNVTGWLGSPSLDAALTGMTWNDRALGGLEMARAVLRAVWYASGNNMQLRGDMFRRTLHVRLESRHERPEERHDFLHPDLLAWAKSARARLLQAALTILRGYIAAGHPDQGLKPWGSFEAWSRLVRGSIVWAGLPDPYETRAGLAEAADTDTQQLTQLLSAWEDYVGFGREYARTLTKVVREFEVEDQLCRANGHVAKFPRLYDVLAELVPPRGGMFERVKLANWFKKFRGRVVNGKRLSGRTNRDDVTEWFIESAGVAGVAGVLSAESRENFSNDRSDNSSHVSMKTTPATPATPADQGVGE